jgi:hypothetical protein
MHATSRSVSGGCSLGVESSPSARARRSARRSAVPRRACGALLLWAVHSMKPGLSFNL